MNELMIDLNVNAETALYEQIYEYIKQNIMDGRLSCGERLPSARSLASNLQVSRSTVDAAYAQLVSEGYLEARRGSGYYVCDVGVLYGFTKKQNKTETFGVHRLSFNTEDLDKIKSDHEKLADKDRDGIKYNFLPGQIDVDSFPYNSWRKSAKEALLELETEYRLLQTGHSQGEYELRQAIAAYLYQARGVCCEPEQMIVGAGNEYLLQLLGQILGNSRKVAMESPTYLQAYHTLCNIGYEIEAVPMDEDGMRIEEIPQKDVTLVYVMPSHQFPLGCVMSPKRRLQLLAWAKEHPNRYIIEDDHDSEFRYNGKPIPSLQGMAELERVIYLGTFSNSIMPSIRVSYMVLPKHLLTVYLKKCGFYASTVSKMLQMTVCHFIEDGYFERHLNKMRGIYKKKRDVLLQLLKESNWVDKIYGDYAGLHIAVELYSSFTEKEIIRRARERGLCIQGISDCYIGKSKRHEKNAILLLGFGNLSERQIREGVGILETCVNETVPGSL